MDMAAIGSKFNHLAIGSKFNHLYNFHFQPQLTFIHKVAKVSLGHELQPGYQPKGEIYYLAVSNIT